jgi:hypothetical protein
MPRTPVSAGVATSHHSARLLHTGTSCKDLGYYSFHAVLSTFPVKTGRATTPL